MRSPLLRRALCSALLLASAAPAAAQLPVCPTIGPEQPQHVVCAPGGRLLAARVLQDLAVDHVLKAELGPFFRHPGDLLRGLTEETFRDDNPALVRYLDALGVARLTRLETALGMLELPVPEEARSFETAVALGGAAYRLSLRLPQRIAGGYWRTPGVVHLALWTESHIGFDLTTPSGRRIEGTVSCLVVSTDDVRIILDPPQVPVVVAFGECN